MFQIFTHSHLSHKFIFVTIHSSELTNMRKNILQAISQLKRKITEKMKKIFDLMKLQV